VRHTPLFDLLHMTDLMRGLGPRLGIWILTTTFSSHLLFGIVSSLEVGPPFFFNVTLGVTYVWLDAKQIMDFSSSFA
jgi:hypothetical protein